MATPNDPAATDNAKAVLNYLEDVGNNTTKVLSGSWRWVSPYEYTEWPTIQALTGRQPAMGGIDYFHWTEPKLADGSTNPDYHTFKFNSAQANAFAISHWNAGGIIEMNSAFYNPETGASGDTNALSWWGNDRAIGAITGSIPAARAALNAMLDKVVGALLELQAAGVPVIWRPWHEWNFYWSPNNGWAHTTMRDIYRYTQAYVSARVHNVLYGLGCKNDAGVMGSDWYPGDDVIDLFCPSVYEGLPNSSYKGSQYDLMVARGKPMIFGEFGAGSGTAPATGYNMLTLVAACQANMPKIAGIMNWGGDYDIDKTHNPSDYMNSVDVLTRDEVAFDLSDPPPTPTEVPSAPSGVSVSAVGDTVTVSWTAPTSTGGSAIVGYRILPDPLFGQARNRLGIKPGSDGPLGEQYMLDEEAWLGVEVDGIQNNAGTTADSLSETFGQFDPNNGGGRHYDGDSKRRRAVISISPLGPAESTIDFYDATTSGGRTKIANALQATIDGTNDGIWQDIANYMQIYPDFIAAIAPEMNGDWMRWSSRGNEALHAAACAHIWTTIRAWQTTHLGSASCLWGVSGAGPSWATVSEATTAAYIADCVTRGATRLGFSFYDSAHTTDARIGTGALDPWVDPAGVFARHQDADFEWWFGQCALHSLPFFTPEWGLQSAADTSTDARVALAGGDDPDFIDLVVAKLDTLEGRGIDLDSCCYFEQGGPGDPVNGYHTLMAGNTVYPNASKRFKEIFGLTPAGQTSLVFKFVPPGSYDWTVTAVNANGDSSPGTTSGSVGSATEPPPIESAISQDFDADADSTLPAPIVATLYPDDLNGSVTVQSHKLSLVPPNSGTINYDRAAVARWNLYPTRDGGITFKVSPDSGEHYIGAWLRTSPDWPGPDRPTLGYALLVSPDATSWQFYRIREGVTEVTIGDPQSFTPSGDFWVRFEAAGATLSGAVWDDGTDEPDPYVAVDDDPIYTSGVAQIHVLLATAAKTVGVDNVDIYRLGGGSNLVSIGRGIGRGLERGIFDD